AERLWREHHHLRADEPAQQRGFRLPRDPPPRHQLPRRGRGPGAGNGGRQPARPRLKTGRNRMKDILMMAYILVWPAVVAVMMILMGRGILRDMRRARRKGEDLV